MKRSIPAILGALLLALGLAATVDAGVYLRARSSTGTTTIGEQDSLVIVKALSGAKVATLPPCPSSIGRIGQQLWIVSDHASDSAVTITRAGTNTIGYSDTTLSLASADDAAVLTCGQSSRWAVGQAATLSGAASVTSLTNSGTETNTGAIYANGGVDRSTAAALTFGGTNATSCDFVPGITVGGGFGTTGTSISSAGVIQTDGAITSADKITGTMFTSTPQTLTVADSGNGSAATATLTPTSSVVLIVCNDADGCTITMGEGSAVSGQRVTIINTSANAAAFADTSGVSELAGAFSMGQYDVLNLVYVPSTWVETSRSNN